MEDAKLLSHILETVEYLKEQNNMLASQLEAVSQQYSDLNNECLQVKQHHGDLLTRFAPLLNAVDNYCNPHSLVCNYQDAVNIQNAILGHQHLLCPYYTDYISDIFKLHKKIPLSFKRLPHGNYAHFISHQRQLNEITRHFDETSNRILYFLLFLRTTLPLMVGVTDGCDAAHALYNPALHRWCLELINSVVPCGWDMTSNKDYNDMQERYADAFPQLREGMYVIDGGAYDGDTAEVFSKVVGESGKVFSFEPSDIAFEKLTERCLPNVSCIKKGLHNKEERLPFMEDDIGSRFIKSGGQFIDVTSIDSFVQKENLPAMDFIKMDIEGSELSALVGAAETIKRFKPILKICIYHKGGDDFIDVPYYLVSTYSNDYDFKITQNSIFWEEAMIIATPL